MKTLLKTLFALMLLVVVMMFASPYYQLYRFKNAIDAGDYSPIITAIDYDSVRPSLKRQLHHKLDELMTHQALSFVLPFLGVESNELKGVGTRFIDGAIDKAVTADNLTKLSQGQITKDSEPLLVALGLWLGGEWLDVPKFAQDYLTTGDIHMAVANQQALIEKQASIHLKPTTPDIGYCGMNCFFIKTTIKDKPVQVLMSRHQLVNWRINELIIN